jgi:hypothetical protein
MNFGIRRSYVGLMFVGRNVQRECEVVHYRQLWRGRRRSTNYQPATSRSEPLTGNELVEHSDRYGKAANSCRFYVADWHQTDMPTALRNVRSQGQSGNHKLALSFSGFDMTSPHA